MSITTYYNLLLSSLANVNEVLELPYCEDPGLSYDKNYLNELILKSEKIDWYKYSEVNELEYKTISEVKNFFIENGIYLGHKLSLRNVLSYDINNKCYISIVIANYNNSVYLEKCINSVINQSLNNIEIIIVDDCSSDSSIEIIKYFSKYDKRIKTIFLKTNQSLHMVRKAGVSVATGKYIMFLDSDDFYTQNACEIAFNTIKLGYDIVQFSLIAYGASDKKALSDLNKYVHVKDTSLKTKYEWLRALYWTHQAALGVPTRIYDAELCKNVFREMKDGYFPRSEDIYETLALFLAANKIIGIEDELYFYRAFSGISRVDGGDDIRNRSALVGDLNAPISQLLERSDFFIFYPSVRNLLLKNSLHPLWQNMDEKYVTGYFNKLAEQYGIMPLLEYLLKNYFLDWSKISNWFCKYKCDVDRGRQIRTIGMIYQEIVNGGIEKVLPVLCDLLIKSNYKVILFLHEKNKNDFKINDNVKIIYLSSYKYEKDIIYNHLTDFYKYLQDLDIDLFIFHRTHRRSMLWEIILLHYLNIPVFLFEHSAYYTRTFTNDIYFKHYENILHCLDKVIVLSNDAEAYYHIRGIDAEYVHNPVRIEKINAIPFEKRRNNILFVGRFSDPLKQYGQCLCAFREIVKAIPTANLILVGSFQSKDDYNKFLNIADRMGILDKITYIEWTDNIYYYYSISSVLLLTSFTESFCLTLAEAQAHGLPAIIYDIPIELSIDNESVISVPQGEYREMALNCVKLLSDKSLWSKLSNVAYSNIKNYSYQSFIQKFLDILLSFRIKSAFKYFNNDTYRRIMKTLSFYGTNQPFRN